MKIGTNRETKNHEYRVAVTPSSVETLVERGHTVLIEKGAGEGSGWSDDLYEKAGASIVDDPRTIFAEAEMVYKVKEPMPWEYELLSEGQVLFTYIRSAGNRPLCKALLESRVLGVAFEDVEADGGRLPLLEPMSFIAGYMGMIKGFELNQTIEGGPGLLPGGMPGVRATGVTIIGGGFVGRGALQVADGLGAEVTILARNPDKLATIQGEFPRVRTLYSNAGNIRSLLPATNILVNAVMWPKTRKGHLVTREMLAIMPTGAVIVDIAADVHGAIETCERQTTHDDPVYVVDGHPHYVVANIPSLAARTASEALAAVTLPYALEIADKGPKSALIENGALRRGVTCLDGQMVRRVTAEWFGCPHLTDEEVVRRLRA